MSVAMSRGLDMAAVSFACYWQMDHSMISTKCHWHRVHRSQSVIGDATFEICYAQLGYLLVEVLKYIHLTT